MPFAATETAACEPFAGLPGYDVGWRGRKRNPVDRDELVAAHGADRPMPDLLEHLARPGCARIGSSWERCGAYYVEPIEADTLR
jgi:hypothetical protein